MFDGRPSYVIQSVSRALRLLDELGRSPRGVTAQQLARRCELPVGTTYHFLRTLCYEGYAVHRPGGRYVLGFKVVDRFSDFLALLERPPAVHGLLQHLAERTGYSFYWGQLIDGRVVITDLFEGPNSPHVEDLMKGFDLAAHATAMGKALISRLPAAQRQTYLTDQGGLRPFTGRTVVDREAIDHELRMSARNGAFTDFAEYRDDLCCAAVLVPGQGQAAIGVTGDVARWKRLGPQLVQQLRISAADMQDRPDPAAESDS